MNKIIIHGRLTRDPDLRKTNSGVDVCTISVAVDRDFVKEGEERQADFFDCTFWRGKASAVAKYFSKGREIVVCGSMQSRKYQDKDGNNRTAWGIESCDFDFCGSKSENSGSAAPVTVVGTAEDYQLLDGDDGALPF